MKIIRLYVLFIAFFVMSPHSVVAQEHTYKTAIVAFYNTENFYDTINNPNVNDDEFLPNGVKAYSSQIFQEKVNHLATVIAQIGVDVNPDGPAILGVAEVENDTVLNDLIHHPLFEKRHYNFIHYDSRDARGIDVALIYNPKYFKVVSSKPLFVPIPEGSKSAFYTRDILWVTGYLDGERVDVFVNHWPSRYGGEKRSMPARIAAAKVASQTINALLKNHKNAKIILMGDLNDNPTDESVVHYLNAKNKISKSDSFALYNPWTQLYKKGLGSLAYQDAWSLFDQIILSQGWLNKKQDGFFFYQNHVFKKPFMIETVGQYKGYPKRTYSGNTFNGGYSDHFPTYVILLKK